MTERAQVGDDGPDDRSVLHVEIGPLDKDNLRFVRVSPHKAEPGRKPCSVGATTLDTLSRLLSERNLALLQIIREQRPRSVAELARLSGRPKASLTLTLRRLEKFGIVAFRNRDERRKVPTVVCDHLRLEVSLDETGARGPQD